MKRLLLSLSSIITVVCIYEIFATYFDQNYTAMAAYITATSGWLVIAYDDVMRFINTRDKV